MRIEYPLSTAKLTKTVLPIPGSGRALDSSLSLSCSISVVIPAYNEATRIASTLQKIHEYLRSSCPGFEILVVNDGSADSTAELAGRFCETMPELKILGYKINRGKGFAVRTGVLAARGELVLLTDADLSTPIDELPLLLASIRKGAPIAIASRHLAQSKIIVRQPLHRRYLGRAFNLLINLLGIRGFRDTQCGFKLFRAAEARQIFSRLKTPGFAFDVEALILARRFGFRVDEIPVRWANSSASRLRPIQDSLSMLLEILRMKGGV